MTHLFDIYKPDYFTDLDLRRIWVWLLAKFKHGSCHIDNLNFVSDPTAPKLSQIVQCAIDSMVFGDIKEYKLLKDILLNDIL